MKFKTLLLTTVATISFRISSIQTIHDALWCCWHVNLNFFGSKECRRVRARDQTGTSKVSPVPCEKENWRKHLDDQISSKRKKTVQNTSQTENRVAYDENRITNIDIDTITILLLYISFDVFFSFYPSHKIAGKSLATSFDCKYIETSSGMQHNVDELLVGILKQIRLKIQKTEQQMQLLLSSPNSTSSSSRSLFRKRSGRRHQQQQQQQQHRVNYQGELAGEGEGSCCISTSTGGVTTGGGGHRITSSSSTNRRSASLRVRRMLGKAVWTCAEYYHRNKSRSCEDLHVL